MKIAIDTSPLKSGHKGRGVGAYTRNLVDSLKKANSEIKFATFSEIIPEADLIHYPYFDFFVRSLPFRKKNKTIVTIHDTIPLVFPSHFPSGIKGSFNLAFQKLSLKSVDHIITDSNSSKKDIVEYMGVPSEKITTVYLAPALGDLDENKINQIDVRKKYQLSEQYMLYVGDINYNKNLPRLISAIGSLSHFQLVIVTRADVDSNIIEASDLRDSISKLPNPNLVKILKIDKQIELASLYKSADWYIQPSLYEGFGLPVLEAMKMGTPVICSQTSSLPEIAGESAIYFNPNSKDKIASAITHAFSLGKIQKQKLIGDGFEQVKKFSWDKVAEETIKVYQKVLG